MGSSKEIVALSDFEHVLKRPTMYIGSVEKSEEKIAIAKPGKITLETREISVGFYKLMTEILDNAFDEAKRMKGEMKRIEIHFLSKTNMVTVVDTGGGFINASKINSKTGMTNVASAMTMLRAGSNFYNDNSQENLIGTNGVGASIVNMLSDTFHIRTVNTDENYEQEWDKFNSKDGHSIKKTGSEETGTSVTFIPRKDIFKGCEWDRDYIHTMMIFRQFMKRTDPIISNLEFICTFDGEALDLDISFLPDDCFKVDTKSGVLYVWESYPQSASVSFVNGAICTGIHQRIIGEWLNEAFESPSAGKFYEAFIVLNLPPKVVRFGDQNKTRFVTSRGEITPYLDKTFLPAIKRQLKTNPIYDRILKRIADSEREGDVSSLRKEKRKQKNKISDKYFPPSSRTKNLFIVEGGSAMGSILQKRDPKTDAVYALKGKIRNARKLSDLTSNSEIVDLMNILNLDPENDRTCKFEKVIISTDADPDGLGHIASLITNLFYKWFPNVIRQGRLFILQTPLLSVDESRKTKYFYSMRDFENYNKNKKPSNVRYLKGLGSLSRPDWEHVFGEMRLFRLAEDSRSDKMMEMAFGTNSALRKKWLQS
jgi:DNA gyrase/topoisomerase IV subunit B